ncbi:MAG TPA: CPXCG motif-containing cysteine-rich protein [Acidiferrobacteraceae bacterium]|nr:CPXCG motif-containing cysteine-rich protein [Acidiferrobacteraceae bacterium]
MTGVELEPVVIECPYCGEPFETALDWSGGSQTYVEDCAVCCRPIQFVLDEQRRRCEVRRDDD